LEAAWNLTTFAADNQMNYPDPINKLPIEKFLLNEKKDKTEWQNLQA